MGVQALLLLLLLLPLEVLLVLLHGLEEGVGVDELVEVELPHLVGHLHAGLVVERLLVQGVEHVAHLVDVVHQLLVRRGHEPAHVRLAHSLLVLPVHIPALHVGPHLFVAFFDALLSVLGVPAIRLLVAGLLYRHLYGIFIRHVLVLLAGVLPRLHFDLLLQHGKIVGSVLLLEVHEAVELRLDFALVVLVVELLDLLVERLDALLLLLARLVLGRDSLALLAEEERVFNRDVALRLVVDGAEVIELARSLLLLLPQVGRPFELALVRRRTLVVVGERIRVVGGLVLVAVARVFPLTKLLGRRSESRRVARVIRRLHVRRIHARVVGRLEVRGWHLLLTRVVRGVEGFIRQLGSFESSLRLTCLLLLFFVFLFVSSLLFQFL